METLLEELSVFLRHQAASPAEYKKTCEGMPAVYSFLGGNHVFERKTEGDIAEDTAAEGSDSQA